MMMSSSVAMADTLLRLFPSRPTFVHHHHHHHHHPWLEGSGFRFALEGLCCEKNHHKSKFLSSCKQQEFRCRNEVVSKQNPPQPQRDFSHLDETSLQQPSRKKWRIMQRLKRSGEGREHVAPIFVRRSDSKWSDSWQSQQVTTLQQLQLQDMALDDTYVVKASTEQAHETGVVLVDLDVQKTGWGFFVRGRVQSSIQQQCNRCFLKYLSPVDSSFEAWLTPTRDPFSHPQNIGEDNDDPTVMYFPPSEEIADLSGMVRDTIRLSQSSKAICSKECENLGPRKWEFGESDHQSVDKQWLPLLKVKRNL
ncbi:unnamed protein product [Sphagnum jensenii]|uniref:Uncharacterized protein n=1 Tax=Sphagnum jensenii TaxID=128206 RepID=A0ABP1BIW3_9BRYO